MGLWFRRKSVDFYDLLFSQAKTAEAGMQALVEYMKAPTAVKAREVQRMEEEADDVREQVVKELNQAFVTPIDREDIYALSRAVDDIIDYGKSTVEEMMAFSVQPTEHLLLMAKGLEEAALAITEAIGALRKDRERAMDRVVFAKKRENYVEHCYREALVELFKQKNVVSILKMREIYRHLSNAADRVDEAANIVGNILVKSA
jgi:predicted phosphate transport protein (TIGR00153 family)